MRSRSSACWSNTASSASPTVEPWTSSSASPPVTARSWVGILTVTPIASDADPLRDLGLEARRIGVDLVHREPIAGRVERLQPFAGDHQDDPLAVADIAPFGELCEDSGRHTPGGLGEDSSRLGEQADSVADLVVRDRVHGAARFARQLQRIDAVGGVADREALGDRVRPLRLADLPTLLERCRHRVATLRLGAVEGRQISLDQTNLEPLAQPPGDLGEQRPRCDRTDDAAGQLPAELLDGFEGERLGALGVVGAKVDVDEGPGTRLRELGT